MRLHRQKPLTLEELQEKDFMTMVQLELLREIVESGKSFLISGATGSGKTTLLQSMLLEGKERVIAIEDVSELGGENIISLQTRSANTENQGEINLDRLVRESLRMRPERIVIGEVRGAELGVMLQALNTGHRGATTLHANSLLGVPERLLSIAAASEMSDSALARLSKSAFDWVISLENRRVKNFGKFSLESNQLTIREYFPTRKLALA